MAKPDSRTQTFKLALLGGDTLLGKDLEEVLRARVKPLELTAFAASGDGTLTQQEGEAVYLEPLDAKATRDSQAILAAGTQAGALKAYGLGKAAKGRLKIIDGSAHLEQQPEARIFAPILKETLTPETWLFTIAHPAARAIALTLKRSAGYLPMVRSVVTIFEPASAHGKSGAAELHQQTTSLLSFKPLEKDIFDAQLGFNLLAQYGEEAPEKLAAVEQRIERHIATLLTPDAKRLPMPSVRVIQAPVFHGYSISLWLEFERTVDAGALGEALASAQIEVRGGGEEAPSSVGAAGQSGLIAGDIRVDRNNPRAAWIWIVCDNLRMTADAAADLVNMLKAEGR